MKTRHNLKNQTVEKLPFVSAFTEEQKQEELKKLLTSRGTYKFQDAVKLEDLQIDTSFLGDCEGNTINLHLFTKEGKHFTIPYYVFNKQDVFSYKYFPQSWDNGVSYDTEIEYFVYSCREGKMIIDIKTIDSSN